MDCSHSETQADLRQTWCKLLALCGDAQSLDIGLHPVQVPEDGSDGQHTGRVQTAAAGAGLGVGTAALPEGPRHQ